MQFWELLIIIYLLVVDGYSIMTIYGLIYLLLPLYTGHNVYSSEQNIVEQCISTLTTRS
jgi:hypothetical protein